MWMNPESVIQNKSEKQKNHIKIILPYIQRENLENGAGEPINICRAVIKMQIYRRDCGHGGEGEGRQMERVALAYEQGNGSQPGEEGRSWGAVGWHTTEATWQQRQQH